MDEFGRTKIFYSIVDGNEDAFFSHIESIIDINAQDDNGMTLLHFAAEYSRISIVEKLIEARIDLEIKDNYGNTALWKAVFNSRGNYEVVDLLLENLANPNSKNDAEKSPFELAVTMNDISLIGRLSEPEFRCGGGWDILAKKFNYTIDPRDQDWTYTIVEPDRVKEYIREYHKNGFKDDVKFSLMEIIIQSTTDQKSEIQMIEVWKSVKEILLADFELHKYTIHYWCCWDTDEIDDCREITPLMRQLWIEKLNVLQQNL